ncbi:uncharacterized protein RSE6_08164 [Rhynchosporium secalis]|uniref:Uncharacterized protein n=1 Tax=Rhynchosporium secalis TaxID=38038 RepID=A0A1E1MET0_RHYSE|nr:uncharacterized protein RSE6_08164 [Rhynchosporium secalis]
MEMATANLTCHGDSTAFPVAYLPLHRISTVIVMSQSCTQATGYSRRSKPWIIQDDDAGHVPVDKPYGFTWIVAGTPIRMDCDVWIFDNITRWHDEKTSVASAYVRLQEEV